MEFTSGGYLLVEKKEICFSVNCSAVSCPCLFHPPNCILFCFLGIREVSLICRSLPQDTDPPIHGVSINIYRKKKKRLMKPRVLGSSHGTAVTCCVLAGTANKGLHLRLARTSQWCDGTIGGKPHLHAGSLGCCPLVGWLLFSESLALCRR